MKVASMTDRWKVESRPQTPIMRKEYPINTTTQKLVKPVQKMQKMVSSVPVVHPIAIRSNKKLKQTSKTHPAPISLPKPKPASTPISLPILVSSDTEESSFIDSESGSDLDSDKESTLSPIEIINDIPRTELPVIVESLSDILDELTSESERESMDEIDVYESNDQYCSSTFSYDEEEEIERTMDRQVCIYKDWSEASEREFSDSDEEEVEAEENENKKQVLETKKMEYKSDLLSLDNSPIKLTENQVLDELLIALADSEVNIGIIPTIPFTSNDTQLDEKRNTTSNKQSCLEREDSSLAVFIKNHQFSNHQKKRTSKHQDMERVSCLVQDYLASHYQMTGHHSNHGSYEDPKKVRVVREKRIKKRIVERFDCREFLDLGSDDTDCEIKNENEENQRKRNDCTWYEEKSKFKFRRYGFQQKMPFS